MSKYRKLRTKYTIRVHLREALKAAGVAFEECRPGQEAHLIGYHGDQRPETATFIVRRDQVGYSSNDLGWHWDGMQFVEIVSEFDQRQPACTAIRQTVKREYAYAAAVTQARSKGYQTERIDLPNGTIQIVVTGRI